MGKPLVSQFEKRFDDRISVVYANDTRNLAEQDAQEEVLAKAIAQVMAGILKREPTQDELLGLVDISAEKVRRKT